MSGCKRAAFVALCISALILVAAACIHWLALPVSDTLRGFLVGLGAGGLFLALLLWFSPGEMRDSAPRSLARRYYREFFPPMACYVIVMLIWKRLLDGVDATWLRVVVALLPAAFVALVIRAVARYVRDSDEMQRRIELESVGIAAGLTGATFMSAGFLQSAKLIDVPATQAMLWVFPALCLFYGVVKVVIARRYA